MKKFSLVMAVILVIAMLTGAASAAKMENGVLRAGEGEGKGFKILLLQQHRNNAFQNGVYEAAVAAAEELGCDLTILSSEADAATQISQIEQAIGEYDAVLYEPVNPDALGAVSKEAADEGVSSSTSSLPAPTGKATASPRSPMVTTSLPVKPKCRLLPTCWAARATSPS